MNQLDLTAKYYKLKPIHAAVALDVCLQTYYNYTSGRTKTPSYAPLALAAHANDLTPATDDETHRMARKLGVSRQLVYRWRKFGTPLMPRLAAAVLNARKDG